MLAVDRAARNMQTRVVDGTPTQSDKKKKKKDNCTYHQGHKRS